MIDKLWFGDHGVKASQNFNEGAVGVRCQKGKANWLLKLDQRMSVIVFFEVLDVCFEFGGQVVELPLDELLEQQDIVFDWNVVQPINVASEMS